MLLMTFLAVAGLAACSDDDEPKDSVKEIRMLVSAETGVTYAWGDDMKKNGSPEKVCGLSIQSC